jgi:hypothetical protein
MTGFQRFMEKLRKRHPPADILSSRKITLVVIAHCNPMEA